jgi:hypothetical protein
MFNVELTPISKHPLSFEQPDWETLDQERKIVLPDVGQGTYRLRLYDWLGSRDLGWSALDGGALFDGVVVVPAGGHGELRVALGAGCITGKVTAPKENDTLLVEVTAVAQDGRAPSRQACCDTSGNFCVRYLSPGTYSLFLHDPTSSFCRVDDVKVSTAVVDVGERALSAGATVFGAIEFKRPAHVPDEVVAVGPAGALVRHVFDSYSSFDRVEFGNLWPGLWTVSVRSGSEVLTTGAVDVKGTGTFHLTLTVDGRSGP